MKLYYWRYQEYRNFGDMLNPWLWPRLLPDFFDDDPATLFLGIGTVLNEKLPPAERRVVLGAGTGYGDPPPIDASWTFYAVRGPLTRDRLGLPKSVPLGDPGILLPDAITPSRQRKGGAAFMPHWTTVGSRWEEVCARVGIRFINPLGAVEEVASEIASSSVVLAEAMHAAIVADAYRVPWIPVHCRFQEYSPFKWKDWCSSLCLEYHSERIVRPLRTGPARGFVRALIRSAAAPVSTAAAAQSLHAALHHGTAMLSEEPVLRQRRDELYEAIEHLKSDFSPAAHITGRPRAG